MSNQTVNNNNSTIRQAVAPLTLSNLAKVGKEEAIDFNINYDNGVEGEGTLEVRLNITGGKRGNNQADEGCTLFTYHGGSLKQSKKGDFFMDWWLLAPKYENKQLCFNDQGIETTKVWVQRVLKTPVAPELAVFLPQLKALSSDKVQAFLSGLEMSNPAQAAELRTCLTGGLTYKQFPAEVALEMAFFHKNVKFKSSNLNKFADQVENIIDTLSDGGTYTLVLRYSFTESVNLASPIKQMQNTAGNPICYPFSDEPVEYKEVSVNLKYIAVEEGNTYIADPSKYANPAHMLDALNQACAAGTVEPAYFDLDKLKAESAQVNAWKTKIDETTGNKWLQKCGYTAKQGQPNSKFFNLAIEAKQGNELAKAEFGRMTKALLQAGVNGSKAGFTKERAEAIIEAAKEQAEAYLATQAELEDFVLPTEDMAGCLTD